MIKRNKIFLGGLMLSLGLALSGTTVLAGQETPRLLDSADSDLQRALNHELNNLGLAKAISRQQLAVSVVDLSDPSRPRVAGVNDQEMLYSASLPKIAILFAAFQRIEDRKLKLSRGLREDLVAMIRYSSNSAATRVLDLVGRGYINKLLMSDGYRFYDPRLGGGLWVGKAYGPEPAFRRDPLNHISHGATALQVARFYYLLEIGQLVSPAASAEMKKILSNPGITHKFVKGLYARYPDAQIYRKSGTWRDYHSDSAIVEHDGKRYVIVALANNPQGSKWLEKLVLGVDRIIPTRSVAALSR